MEIKLSVIVPVYNVEKYIKRCLDSLLAQTYRNLEIILVDDGSTDKSGLICDDYARKDCRIQVIHKKNGGIVSARKVGILYATGEYTTNVDPDDWIEPEAYETMVERLNEYSTDIVAMGYKKEYTDFVEECWGGMPDGYYLRDTFWNIFHDRVDKAAFFCQPVDMSLCNKVIRTELWKKHQLACPDKLKKNVDDAVIFPCLLDMKSIYVEAKFFYHYCVRKTSILWETKNQDYKCFLELSRHLILSLRNNNVKNKLDETFLLYKILYHMILDVPERLISADRCMIYPQIMPKSNIIVYGKGVFANRLMNRIKEMEYCNIVENVDKFDVEKLRGISNEQYDYIVVAIFNSSIVTETIRFLIKFGIPESKVCYMDKKNMRIDALPFEIKGMWGWL